METEVETAKEAAPAEGVAAEAEEEEEEEGAEVIVSLSELCRIAGNRAQRSKATVILEESMSGAEGVSQTSLVMLDDPEGAALGKYDKYLPKAEKEVKEKGGEKGVEEEGRSHP